MADDTIDPATDAGRPIPCRHPDGVSVSTGSEGEHAQFFLKTAAGEIFVFGAQEHFLWELLDGNASYFEVREAFTQRFGWAPGPDDLTLFIEQVAESGLLEWHGEPGYDLGVAADPAPPMAATRRQRPPTERPGPPAFAKEPFTCILGDPTRMFTFLAKVWGPIRYVKWLWFVGAFLALMILIKHWTQYQSDWGAVRSSIPFWPCMYGFEHLLAFVSRIVEGSIIVWYGGKVRYLGLRFFMGILVRGFLDESTAREMPRTARVWSKGGPLIFRIAVFVIATFVWIEFRSVHPITSKAALFCTVLAAFTLCLNACPLVAAEGYELLATYLNQPELQSRAFKLMGIRLTGRDAPGAMGSAERIGLAFFAVGTVLASGFIILHILMEIDNAAIGAAQGLGFAFVVGVYIVSALYFFLLIKFGLRMIDLQKAILTAHQRGGGNAGH